MDVRYPVNSASLIKSSLYTLFFAALALLFSSCDRNEYFKDKNYPLVETELISVSEKGVKVGGHILAEGEEKIVEKGFYFGYTPSDLVYKITTGNTSGYFTYFFDHDIPEGEVCLVRSYVKTADMVSYGNIVQFLSEGFQSREPEIYKINPETVINGEKVVLTGNFNSIVPDNITVFIDNSPVQEQECILPDSITFIPANLSTGLHSVFVKVSGVESNKLQLDIQGPVINAFYPMNGYDGTEVTITGHYFRVNPMVIFGELTVTPTFISDSLIRFNTPLTTLTGNITIGVKNVSEFVLAENDFFIDGHSVTGISKELAGYNDEVEIYGSGFIQGDRLSEVYLDNMKQDLISCTENKIVFKPSKVELETVVTVVNGEKSVNAGILYVEVPREVVSVFPNSFLMNGTGIGYNEKAYFGFGYDDSYFSNSWYSFEPATSEWTRLADCELADQPVLSFAMNGNIYIAAEYSHDEGYPDTFYIHKPEIYEYNIGSDSWQYMTSIPDFYELSRVSVQVAGNETYFMIEKSFYSLDQTGHHWVLRSSPKFRNNYSSTTSTAGFYLNGRLYWLVIYPNVSSGTATIDIHEYSFANDIWTQLDSKEIPDYPVVEITPFVLNNFGYLSGGRIATSSRDYSMKVLKFDPINLTITEVSEIPDQMNRYAVAVVGNTVYIGMGYSGNEINKFLWSFIP